ncbi:hypothetical protein BASA81_001467 [Batrachochytrium salamandrivorans]|nr:hypothetical protein BASA81_001467 [Batrachochytrium salamandrivorans]
MLLLLLLVVVLGSPLGALGKAAPHTSNYALIVDTSMNYFNYRHVANSLAVYRAVKAGGIPDNNIILMLAEDIACNARNPFKGSVFDDDSKRIDLFDSSVQVDYRGEEVTVENVLRVISGRHLEGTPKSKRLDSTVNSNVLMYFSGHGGDGFLKFRDTTTMSSPDIAAAVAQMKQKGRFRELLFVVDTCQAGTLFEDFVAIPDVVAIGSSVRGESSYSLTHDYELGVAVTDRFTYHLLRYFEQQQQHTRRNLMNLFQSFSYAKLHSHATWHSSLNRDLGQVLVTDFFSAVLDVKRTANTPRTKLNRTMATAAAEEPAAAEEDWDYPLPLFL